MGELSRAVLRHLVKDDAARQERHLAHLSAHMLALPDGSEVRPGDVLEMRDGHQVTFMRITRAPGDGTGTNGKIEVEDSTWISPLRELYPSVFDLKIVCRPGAVSPYNTDPIYTGETFVNERGQRGHWSLAGTWIPEA